MIMTFISLSSFNATRVCIFLIYVYIIIWIISGRDLCLYEKSEQDQNDEGHVFGQSHVIA